MESAIKVVKLIRLALLVSIVLYAVLGELVVRPPSAAPDARLFNIATLIAIVMVAAILVVRRFVLGRAEEALSSSPPDSRAASWRTGYILTYVICEAIALLGLMLRLLGFSSGQVAPFYLAGIVLLLFFQPRWPAREAA